VSKLGAGGMGEVYRARDDRLGRDVAIKVLPADFAKDADRLRRFEQEARATSALNHPNILTVYDIGTHEDAPHIVAELLEGEELRDQLNDGALAPRKAIDYAQQIAAGLAAAHGKGITHRDLKPENLFITIDGRVKILDFGLAKLRPKRRESADSVVATQRAITDAGTVMGTVGYMSPEQVRGQDADHRSDIFSFGVILYEMLRGRRTFTGESAIEVMNAILKEEPEELTESNQKINPALERIVRRCLEKKAERRFQSTSDLCFAIEALSIPSGSTPDTAVVTERTVKARLFDNARVAWSVAAVFLIGLLATLPSAVNRLRHAPPAEAAAARFVIAAPENVTALRSPVISPDGRNLVFEGTVGGQRHLWLRPLGSLKAQLLPGTEGSAGIQFWSPDSLSICFTAERKLKKIDLAGGPAQTLCSLPGRAVVRGTGGGAWSSAGVILFTSGGMIHRVSAAGGEPTPALEPDQSNQEALYRWPTLLPDGRHFLYLRMPRQQGSSEIYLASLDGKETTRLLAADSHAVYAASDAGSGYLLFARAGALLAQPFDADSLKLTGESFIVAEAVAINASGRGFFSVSDNDILVYDQTSRDENEQLAWIDRAGKMLEPVGPRGAIQYPRLSPDGKQVAIVRQDPQTGSNDIYVVDLARGTSARLTFDPANDGFPIWSPDGSRIVWTSGREGGHRIYQKLSSGVGQDEFLFKDETGTATYSWSPDSQFILYTRGNPGGNLDVWVLPLEGDRKPFPFLQTSLDEGSAGFSPDGRWVAYRSTESGRDEVYVQTFPTSGGKRMVSPNGGYAPQWRGDGKELFYISGDGKLMAVEVKPGNSFELGVPKALFDLAPVQAKLANNSFAVTADGQRFLFVRQGEETASLQYTVVVNWTAELKK